MHTIASLLCIVMTATGQQLTFDHITINEGLSNNTVYSIVQDNDGFMWFGTRDGLNRYDGYEFKVFKSDVQDTNSLPSNIVLSLFANSNGDIWIGLRRGGIVVFRRRTQAFDLHPVDLESSQDLTLVAIQTFFQDSQGDIWVGTAGLGVLQLDNAGHFKDQFASFLQDTTKRLRSDHCFSFAEDRDHSIWIGTDGNAVHRYDRKSGRISYVQGPGLYSYRKSLLVKGDSLLIGTESNGLFIYNISSASFQDHLLPGKLIRDVSWVDENRLFISTDGAGLYVLDTGQDSLINYRYETSLKNSLNTDAIYDIYTDRDGNTWLSTFNGGLNLLKSQGAPFYNYLPWTQSFQTPGAFSVLSFFEELDGSILVGMDGAGIWQLRPGAPKHLMTPFTSPAPEAVTGRVITAIFRDSRGVLWIGSFAHGITRVSADGTSYRNFIYNQSSSDGITNNNIWDITEDHDGRIWIASLGGGIMTYDPDALGFRSYQPQPGTAGSLSDWNAGVIYVDHANRVWIGTEDGGLNLYDRDQDKFDVWSFDPDDSTGLRSNTVLSIFEDAQHRLWIGTEGAGLHLFDQEQGTFEQYSIHDGLQSNVIHAIEQDASGILWLSTNDGISSFDPASGEILNFDSNDGLSSDQFNSNASLHASSGELIFGNIRGANGFNPGQINVNNNPPEVVFTDFQLFNKSIDVGENSGRQILSSALNDSAVISLLYSENVFTIAFAALEYTNPRKNMYAYRLLGFEDTWNYVDASTRRATYTNLDPGKYTFEVKASNNNNVWSGSVRRLWITIAPPFYETMWFKISFVCLLVVVLVLIIKFRDARRKERHNKELLVAEQKILQLQNYTLNAEVRQKNAELSAALLQSAHKNKALDGLRNQLAGLTDQAGYEDERRSEIRRLIKKIENELDGADYWEQFQLNFNQLYQQFAERIHVEHPKLTQNDLRLCCLLKINLTNREIASIQNISLGGVEKSKFRLKRKLDLEPQEDLNAYILGFS